MSSDRIPKMILKWRIVNTDDNRIAVFRRGIWSGLNGWDGKRRKARPKEG